MKERSISIHRLYGRQRKLVDQSPLIIAGSGRSGTTWLLELVCSDPRYQMAFEPLHPTKIPGAGMWANKFLAEQEEWPGARDFFATVFSGSLCTPWSLYRPWLAQRSRQQRRHYYFRLFSYYLRLARSYVSARQVAAKFIRANLMLPWLVQEFNASIFFVIRNPYAVVSSWCKTRWFDAEIDGTLAGYLQQNALVRHFLRPHLSWISQTRNRAQKIAILWAIGNYIPLAGPMLPNMTIIPYEFLLRYTKNDFGKAFQRINKQCDFSEKYLRRESSTTFKTKKTESAYSKEAVQEVLRRFDMGLYTATGAIDRSSPYFRKWHMDSLAPQNY